MHVDVVRIPETHGELAVPRVLTTKAPKWVWQRFVSYQGVGDESDVEGEDGLAHFDKGVFHT